MAAGWSYDEIGGSYLELGQAEQAVHYFTAAQAAGRAEGERSLVRSGLVHLGAPADNGETPDGLSATTSRR